MGRIRSRGGRFFDADAFGTRRRKGMFFDSVISTGRPLSVTMNSSLRRSETGFPFPVRDMDLDELQGYGDLVLEGFRNCLPWARFMGIG